MGCIDWRRYFDDENQYAMGILKDDTIVGHISRYVSQIYYTIPLGTPLERNTLHNLFTVFSKGWYYNLCAHRRKEVFFTPAAEYTYYNFWYKIFSNVILFCEFKFHIATTHTKFLMTKFSRSMVLVFQLSYFLEKP